MIPEGVTLTYQGRLCAAAPFEYARPAGLEPGFGFVHVFRDEFRDFTIRESLPGVDTLEAPHTTGAEPGFASAGELVFTEVAGGVEHAVRIQQVLVTERAVEVALAQDDENALCRVELTDVRYLWETRGAPVFGWVNVPARVGDDDVPGAPGATTSAPGPAGSAPGATPGVNEVFIPGSLRAGAPWTLRQVLEGKILPRLPGAPRLARLPAGRENAVPRGHVWNGVLPKRALADVLREFELVLTLNLDGSVSIWERGEGDLQLVDGQLVVYDPGDPALDERVASTRALVAYKHVPAAVAVLGGRVVNTARLALEPAGEIGGKLVPLERALQATGLTLDEARRAVLLPHDRRAALLRVAPEVLRELERWAFRWWRLPGGARVHADKLPLLPGRGVVDSVGQWLPHRVFSEGHTVFSVMEAKLAQLEKTGLGSAPTRVQDKVLDAIEKNVSHFKVVANLPFAQQASGYRIDLDRGVVQFDAVQGHVAVEGASLDEAELAKTTARVELEFGYVKRSGWDDDLTSELRYASHWTRRVVAGKPVTESVPVLAAGVAPVLRERPDLELVLDAAGASNRAILDASAKKAAEDVFAIEQSSRGAVVTFCRPVPVVTTGKILTVTWSTDNERPRVVAHVGVYAPLAREPRSDLRTRAFGPQDGAVRGSVIAPGGLS